MHANVPDNYYVAPEYRSAPRGTYGRAVRLMRDGLADLIHDAALEGEILTIGVVRKHLAERVEWFVSEGDEAYPIERLDSGEWDDAIDEAIDGSRFAECPALRDYQCSVSVSEQVAT